MNRLGVASLLVLILVSILAAQDQDADAEDVAVRTTGGLSSEWTDRTYRKEDIWAFQQLKRPTVPDVISSRRGAGNGGAEAINAIDRFVDAKLAEADLASAPPVDRRTLLRRATYSLCGLPPTLVEVEQFIADPEGDDVAYSRLLDRLLASPQYGEHWGRHWLDVVRYADSSGLANDFERGCSWRYRDYVIRSFNRDTPYSQFLREQIAGDELASATETSDLADASHERLIAVGFLRMGPWELTGMEVAKVARQRFLDDVTDIVGQVFLAQPLQCARCHDHKFDPIPTRDYYSLQSCFATTQFADRPVPFLKTENLSGFEEKQYLLARQEEFFAILRRLDDKSLAAARHWFADQKKDATAFEQLVEDSRRNATKGPKGKSRTEVYDEVRRVMQQRGTAAEDVPPRHAGFSVEDFGLERIARKGLERLGWELDRYEPIAMSVYSGPTPNFKTVVAPLRLPAPIEGKVNGPKSSPSMMAAEVEQTCILAGGDPFSPRDPVVPAGLSAIDLMNQAEVSQRSSWWSSKIFGRLAAYAPAIAINGRRAALADWLLDSRNPVTPRVMANRIWTWHFGRGIAGNPNNFGATGKKPTHPELLDWLALELVERDWSCKELTRHVMSSAAFRRGAVPAEMVERSSIDPYSLYAGVAPRRLTAEELQDSIRLASGELNLAMGGIPVRPEIHSEVALQPRQVMGTFAPSWQPSTLPSQRHRRSVYSLRLRGIGDPFLEVFNEPVADLSCEVRDQTNMTPQVFALMNSRSMVDRAVAMACRLVRERSGLAAEFSRVELSTEQAASCIDGAFEILFGRNPRDRERSWCIEHSRAMTDVHRHLESANNVALDRLRSERPAFEVVRMAVEENTGERFRFTEKLHSNVDFVADMGISEVSRDMRGLVELCLVLLNSNEFVFVD